MQEKFKVIVLAYTIKQKVQLLQRKENYDIYKSKSIKSIQFFYKFRFVLQNL